MRMNKRILIIGGILVLIVVVALAWSFGGGGSDQEVSDKAPVDVVLDFYDPWLSAAQSTSTDPYQEGLAKAPILSEALRDRLADSEGNEEDDLDPVLCQSVPPPQIAARPVFEREDKAQVLVTSRQEGMTGQAVITLLRLGSGWYIDDIECSAGEFAPEQGEFSFEREGFLLKSVPEPLDSRYWHLIFEENGEPGHFVPLLFDEESMCEAADGTQSVCNPDQFTDAEPAFVQGDMTELGLEVKRLKLRK